LYDLLQNLVLPDRVGGPELRFVNDLLLLFRELIVVYHIGQSPTVLVLLDRLPGSYHLGPDNVSPDFFLEMVKVGSSQSNFLNVLGQIFCQLFDLKSNIRVVWSLSENLF